MVYLVAVVKKETTKAEVNAVLKARRRGSAQTRAACTATKSWSRAISRSNPFSSIVDAKLTGAQGDLIQLGLWYDNEWGYSCRLADVTRDGSCEAADRRLSGGELHARCTTPVTCAAGASLLREDLNVPLKNGASRR